MKKYTFAEKTGKKITKHEIIAESLEEAQHELATGKLGIRNELPISIEYVYNENDVDIKIYSVSYYKSTADALEGKLSTLEYKAISRLKADTLFLEDFPEQNNNYREIQCDKETKSWVSLANNIKNENTKTQPKQNNNLQKSPKTLSGSFKYISSLLDSATNYIKLFTVFLFSIIIVDLLVSVLFGKDSSLGAVNNIILILRSHEGLSGIVGLFIIYFLFIRSNDPK